MHPSLKPNERCGRLYIQRSCRERRIQERRRRIQERLAALREGETAGPVHKSEAKQMDPGKQQGLEAVRKIMALRAESSAAVKAVPPASGCGRERATHR